MPGTMEILIREMTIEDYEAVYHCGQRSGGLESGVLMIQKREWNDF